MITTRERLRPSELLEGLTRAAPGDALDLFEAILPLEGRHALLTNQGKSAFEQIVLSAELQRSRILVPAFFPDDFVGIFRRYEMTPVFVDVDPDTYHLDLNALSEAQLRGARAMIVLHTFGLPVDGPAYRAFCDDHGLVMIEDCARALGAARGGALAGSSGHYAVFSLPKCTPVREGGVAVSERPLRPRLEGPTLGVAGLLHAMTLVRYPVPSLVERWAYGLLADTAIYPREVGNYDPLPARELDPLGRLMLRSFLPHYGEALVARRACAQRIRRGLEHHGFVFQADGEGHIYTALSMSPPEGCDPGGLQAFLLANGVKASAMWRNALGVSEFARQQWGADPEDAPVARVLSRRLLQLPVSRFQRPEQSDRIVSLCLRSIEGRAT